MNILVIGCGRMGTRLAETLDLQGHDIAVIDSNSDAFRTLPDSFSGATVCGTAMDMRVLKSASVESCVAVAVVTSDDNLNITVCQIVKEFFGVTNVLARISVPTREQVFTRFGLKTVCPTNLAADTMGIALVEPWASCKAVFGCSTLCMVPIEAKEEWIGMDIRHLEIGNGRTIIAVVRADGRMELVPHHTRITVERGDQLIMASVSD